MGWRRLPSSTGATRRTDSSIARYTAQVRAVGGLAGINHPFFPDTTNRFRFAVRHFDGIEVWNGRWDARNERALAWWDALLRRAAPAGRGRQRHAHAAPSPNQLGRPRTVVQASALSRAACIMQGLRARRAYLVADHPLAWRLRRGPVASRPASATPWPRPPGNASGWRSSLRGALGRHRHAAGRKRSAGD
ncbi:MAG: hypothetical protein WKG07_11370 [Hymenobacter sp.]